MSDVRGEELKMWLAVREDLAMPRGKLAVQAGHAFVECILMCHQLYDGGGAKVREYMRANQPKIAVKAKNLAALQRAYDECLAADLPCVIIEDLGRTVFPEPTITVMAVGPCRASELPRFVQRLQLLKDPTE